VKFTETPLLGAYVVDMEPVFDERGYFARSFCREEFLTRGLNPDVVQCNVSFNAGSRTLRGMHYQLPPHAEEKLVRCTRGTVHDVILDLRPGSPTRLSWFALELSAANGRMLYIPEGFAHGFMTLENDSEVFYQMSRAYAPGYARGIRWNDPLFDVPWPHRPLVISDKDRAYPDFAP